jgi:hypothetical protein
VSQYQPTNQSQCVGSGIYLNGSLIGMYNYATAGVHLPTGTILIHPGGGHAPVTAATFNALPK